MVDDAKMKFLDRDRQLTGIRFPVLSGRPSPDRVRSRERTKNANQNTYMLTSASGHDLTDVMTTVNRKLFRWRKRKRPNNWFSGMAEFAGFAATPRPPRGRPEAAAPAPSRHWHSPGSARKPGFIRCSELEIFLVNSAAFRGRCEWSKLWVLSDFKSLG